LYPAELYTGIADGPCQGKTSRLTNHPQASRDRPMAHNHALRPHSAYVGPLSVHLHQRSENRQAQHSDVSGGAGGVRGIFVERPFPKENGEQCVRWMACQRVRIRSPGSTRETRIASSCAVVQSRVGERQATACARRRVFTLMSASTLLWGCRLPQDSAHRPTGMDPNHSTPP
jgi:hypothetical protein